MNTQVSLDMSPGQIWSGSDLALFPLRWETVEGFDSLLVVEVFRGKESYEVWASLDDLFSEFPGARRLA